MKKFEIRLPSYPELSGRLVAKQFAVSTSILCPLLTLSTIAALAFMQPKAETEAKEQVESVWESPTPTPEPTPSPSPSPAIPELFTKYFGSEARTARAIAKAENYAADPKASHTNSDFNGLPNKPWKHHFAKGSEDHGIMQLNLFWNWEKIPGETKEEKITWLQDPENNIKLAKQIRDGWGNYGAWSTYKSGKYKKYLNQ